MRKTMFVKQKFLILTSIIIILIVFVLGRSFIGKINTRTNDESKDKTTSVKNEPTIEAGCTRNVRLENEPQYDRALSLIKQRLDDNNKTFSSTEYEDSVFKFFPTQLTNCIQVIEANIETGTEGFFIFNSKDVKSNYYPITVDTSYNLTDDVLTALLLAHEMTHVQQYIDKLNGSDDLSCIGKEVDAFISQLDFYVTLNTEENSAAYYRIQNDDSLHPQLEMINSMTTINRESGCKIMDRDCKEKRLRSELKDMIFEDDFYRNQCDI